MDSKEKKKFVCECFDDIENKMIVEALDHYYKADYGRFRRDLEFMSEFLSVKDKLKCHIE